MKKRYSMIFTFTAAAVLVSSIAYASKKKVRATSDRPKQGMAEVDLAANLLDSSGEHKRMPQKVVPIKKQGDESLKELIIAGECTSSVKAAGR
jgi:hypothetical protein